MRTHLTLVSFCTLMILTNFHVNAGSCLDNCNNNGDCNLSQKCLCYDGWFDTTCDVQAARFHVGVFISTLIEPDAWTYFYFPIKGVRKDIQINWRADVGQLIINTVTMRENNSYLPDEEDPSRILNAQGTVRTINVRLKDLKNFPNGKIVIGIKNVNPVPLNIGIQLDLDYPSVSSIVTLSITLGIAITTLVVITTFICWIYKRKRQNEDRESPPIGSHLEIQVQPIPLPGLHAPKCLTRAELHKYFPKEKFFELKSPFNQTICAVCLDEFQKDAMCHQLYCGHIFHDVCIETWLSKHESCPDCRKPITILAITEFLNKEKNSSDEDKARAMNEMRDSSSQVAVDVSNQTQLPQPEAHVAGEEQDSVVQNLPEGSQPLPNHH